MQALHARFFLARRVTSLVLRGSVSEIDGTMPDNPDVAPMLRASTQTPAPSFRCPRCGSRTGALEATSGDDASGDRCSDRYCGCCGLIVPIAR